jgi:hypothetical protein
MSGPAELPRQTRAHRIRTVALLVDRHPDGTLVFRSPAARGWARGVRNRYSPEVGRVVDEAFVENEIVAYGKAHNVAYDLDALTEVDPDDPTTQYQTSGTRHLSANRVRPGWQLAPDDSGDVISPQGKRWGAHTQMAARVRSAMGRREPGEDDTESDEAVGE